MFPKSVKNLATVKTIQFIHSNHLQGSLVSRDYFFKGQSNEIFDPQYFSSFEPAWATDQWVKQVSILLTFSQSYSNFSIEKTYFSQYHTARSQKNIIL